MVSGCFPNSVYLQSLGLVLSSQDVSGACAEASLSAAHALHARIRPCDVDLVAFIAEASVHSELQIALPPNHCFPS